jgi:hypothetical protein
MPALSFSDRDRLARRGSLPFTTLLVLAVASALTGAIVAIVTQRYLQRQQIIDVLPQPAPVPVLREGTSSMTAAHPAAATAAGGSAATASPLGAVGASLSAKRLAELEHLLVEDDVIAGDGSDTCPPEFPIKANGRSGIYHWPGALAYGHTHPTLCFRSAESADRAGFRPAKR